MHFDQKGEKERTKFGSNLDYRFAASRKRATVSNRLSNGLHGPAVVIPDPLTSKAGFLEAILARYDGLSFISAPPLRGRPPQKSEENFQPTHSEISPVWPKAGPVYPAPSGRADGQPARVVEATAQAPLRVVLADDSRMFREALLAQIRQVVGKVEIRETNSARELFESCAARPGFRDLFLVDMSISGIRGSAGLRELRRLRPDAMVVAFNCKADPAEARIALECGVSAYLLRSMSSGSFAAALGLVMQGERFFAASVMYDALKLATQHAISRPACLAAESATEGTGLTPRQLSVMRHIVAGKSNKDIARALQIQEITIKVHLQAIFARMNVSNRTQAAIHAERHGWFTGEGEMLPQGDGGTAIQAIEY